MHEIIEGDCLEVMKTFPDNHFSAIVTDPPYGLKFMGKDWDHGIPGIEFWKEALRISKPGSHLLSFGGTRTYHRLTCSIEDAGWEIRDCLMWLFGNGFPKGKGCLKPAYEPIILARKKAPKPQLNIDECRIPTEQLKNYSPGFHKGILNDDGWKGRDEVKLAPKGRWPANVMFDEEAADMLDEQTGILKTAGGKKRIFKDGGIYKHGIKSTEEYFPSSAGGASRFFYCPKTSTKERNSGLQDFPDQIGDGLNATVVGDSRTGNKTIQKNNHPTVKPLALMRYLITLVSPHENALILDPFAGSGSTILAAKQLGIAAIGIEKQPEYAKIARSRVENWQTEE